MIWTYPTNATPAFRALGEALNVYRAPDFAPDMKDVLMAQWALESGWGTSNLARLHRNYAGMKWRDMMKPFAVPVTYAAHDGTEPYCAFKTNKLFVDGYFHRLDNLGPYAGWRDAASHGGLNFIAFIGPTWLGLDEARNQEYVRKIQHLVEKHSARKR